jgi:hypothetical protein
MKEIRAHGLIVHDVKRIFFGDDEEKKSDGPMSSNLQAQRELLCFYGDYVPGLRRVNVLPSIHFLAAVA